MKVGYRRLCYRAYDNPAFIWNSDLEGRFHCKFVWYPKRVNGFDYKFTTTNAEQMAARRQLILAAICSAFVVNLQSKLFTRLGYHTNLQ